MRATSHPYQMDLLKLRICKVSGIAVRISIGSTHAYNGFGCYVPKTTTEN